MVYRARATDFGSGIVLSGGLPWGSRVWGSTGLGPPISDLAPYLPGSLEPGGLESGGLLWGSRIGGSTGLGLPISDLEPYILAGLKV